MRKLENIIPRSENNQVGCGHAIDQQIGGVHAQHPLVKAHFNLSESGNGRAGRRNQGRDEGRVEIAQARLPDRVEGQAHHDIATGAGALMNFGRDDVAASEEIGGRKIEWPLPGGVADGALGQGAVSDAAGGHAQSKGFGAVKMQHETVVHDGFGDEIQAVGVGQLIGESRSEIAGRGQTAGREREWCGLGRRQGTVLDVEQSTTGAPAGVIVVERRPGGAEVDFADVVSPDIRDRDQPVGLRRARHAEVDRQRRRIAGNRSLGVGHSNGEQRLVDVGGGGEGETAGGGSGDGRPIAKPLIA